MDSPQNGPVVFLLGSRTKHEDFVKFAKKNGWIMREEHAGDGTDTAFEQVWTTPSRGTAIHYLNDPVPNARFLVVYGPDAGDISFDVGASFDAKNSDDAMEFAGSVKTDDQRADAAWMLAVTAKVFDDGVLRMLKRLYDGGSDDVREAVINATGYRGWPEARGFLEQIAEKDPSADLRENAQAILAALRQVEQAAKAQRS